MKILAIFFVAVTAMFNSLSVTYTDAVLETSSQQVLEVDDLAPSGIIMEEIAMLANSGDDNNPITNVAIYDKAQQELVHEEGGCNESFCSFNLSHLPEGIYYAIVYTEDGSFSDFIEIK